MKVLVAREIAYFFHRHNKFKNGIYYIEIKKNFFKLNDILKELQIQNYSSDMSIFIIINDFNEKLFDKITNFDPILNLLYISNRKKKNFEGLNIDGIQNSKSFIENDSSKKNKIHSVKSNVSDNINNNIKNDLNSSFNSIENEFNDSIDYDNLIIQDHYDYESNNNNSINNSFSDIDNNINNNNINFSNNNNNNNIINYNEDEDDNNSSNKSIDNNYFNSDKYDD